MTISTTVSASARRVRTWPALLGLGAAFAVGPVQGGGTLTTCSQLGLELLLSSGGVVTVTCPGEITLTNTLMVLTNVTIEGSPAGFTLSGNDQVRIFQVAEGVTLTLKNIRLVRGRVEAPNGREGDADSPSGRAADSAVGAAILNSGGNLVIDRCSFTDHNVIGGAGGVGYTASGCEDPGSGGIGGDAVGAAIFHSGGTLTIRNTTFARNAASGGLGGDGGSGGACILGTDGRTGRRGGSALGGAVYVESGTAEIVSSTFYGNSLEGGNGGRGGDGSGRLGAGDDGGNGGHARGGAVYIHNGEVILLNCTSATNMVSGGERGERGVGEMSGIDGSRGNIGRSEGASIYRSAGTFAVQNSMLSGSQETNQCAGVIVDLGHNLSSDESCSFAPSGNNGVDTRLSTFQNYGGFSDTLVPQGGSPAIDAANPDAAPPLDQRAFTRVGPPDIGATEAGAGSVQVSLVSLTTNLLEIAEHGVSPARYRVTRTGSTIASLEVGLAWQGEAEPDADFVLVFGGATNDTASVVIPAGTNRVEFLVQPIDDNLIEPPETIQGSLGLGPYTIGPGSATFTLTLLSDDPDLLLSFSPEDGFNLQFVSVTGYVFTVEASSNFSQWQTLTNFPGTGQLFDWRDPESLDLPQRFYRLSAE